ncbi:hypothetical protein KY329_05150 [Candidatus Woesearchaeota archaeon]|nr:hypothetical protein [Candidatus Woesearchaeota archaeon]
MKITTKLIYIFALLILFVIYFIGIYSNITPKAVREDFRERLYSSDIALTLDSMQALRRDLSAEMAYYLPEDLHAVIQPHRVLVYEQSPSTGEEFGFTINPEFNFPERSEQDLQFHMARSGESMFVSESRINHLDNIICPEIKPVTGRVSVSPSFFPSAADYLVNTFSTVDYANEPSGGAFVGFIPGRGGVEILANEDGRGLGCRIMKAFIRDHQFADINVIPVYGDFFRSDDARAGLSHSGTNVLISFNPSEYPEFIIASAVSEGLAAYGVV